MIQRSPLVALGSVVGCCLLMGWSATGPLTLASGSNEQVQPKMGVATDGGFFMAWFDNATGGYDVRANRFDASGAPMWGPNGTLVADRSFSSTVDYSAWVCSGNRFAVTYNDDRLGGDRISVSLLNSSGGILWTNTINSAGAYVANPKVCEDTDGSIYAAWYEGTGTKVQKFDPTTGAAIWPASVLVKDGTATTMPADLWPAADASGGVMVSAVRYTTFTGAKTIKAFRVSSAGVLGWSAASTAPSVVFSTGSLQIGNFPPCKAIPGVGYVFCWYANAPLQCHVQLLDQSGVAKFGASGVPVTTTTTNERVSPTFAVDEAADRVYVTWAEHVPASSLYGVGAQAFALSGAGLRLWGNSGIMLSPIATLYSADFTAVTGGSGRATFAWQSSTQYGFDTLYANQLNADGTSAWTDGRVQVAPATDKSKMASVRLSGASVFAWGDGATGGVDILAQRVGDDRSIGGNPTDPADLNGDGLVDGTDLTIVLAAWGTADANPDINDDGIVDGLDLTIILAGWN
ncbi:MAG: hypothetical protein EXS03_06355 [Phycisphaerales bacterium]|nr:hypothetical protein [Phycisphaerales bacterium]